MKISFVGFRVVPSIQTGHGHTVFYNGSFSIKNSLLICIFIGQCICGHANAIIGVNYTVAKKIIL